MAHGSLRAMRGDGFNPALHGLRGLAVAIVLLSHWGNAGHCLLPFPHDAIGKAGVWIFFALSAYLLTDRLAQDRRLAPYTVNRVARIMPLYLLALALHAAVGDIAWADLWRHALMLDAYQEAWAIPVEFTYYLALPLIALPPRWAGTVLALAGVGVALLAPPAAVFSNGLSILPKLAPFALGSLAALWKPRIGPRWAVAAFAGLLLGVVAYREGWGDPRALSLLLGLSSSALILACTEQGVAHRLFSATWLVWLGKVSFSLYLLHMFAVRFIPDPWLGLAVTLAASALTYRYFELPPMQCARRLMPAQISDTQPVLCRSRSLT